MSQATARGLQVGWLCGALVFFVSLGAATPSGAESRRERIAALERLNERWTGAQCQLRTHWKIRKKSDEGWFKTGLVEASSDEFKRIMVRLRVRDRQALSRRIRGDVLLAGTLFECLGFRFREEKELDNLYLAMRSLNEGVEAELLVWVGSWMAKPDLKAVPGVERFLRLHVLDVTPRGEQLTTLGSSSRPSRPVSAEERARAAAFFAGERPAPAAPPTAPAAAVSSSAGSRSPDAAAGAADTTADTVYRPAVEILAVSVQPPQVRPGAQVELVVNYTVSGLPPAAKFAVTETRSLAQGERTLTSSSAETPRANGTYTSSLEATIPAAAGAGIYRLSVDVGLPGAATASGSALFEVVP